MKHGEYSTRKSGAGCERRLEFLLNRESHLNNFGHLLFSTELLMFGLPLAAVYIGFFEMMARERAGIVRAPPQIYR